MNVPDLCDALVAAGYTRAEIVIEKNAATSQYRLHLRGSIRWRNLTDGEIKRHGYLTIAQEPLFLYVLRTTGTLGSWNTFEGADIMVDEIKSAQVMARLRGGRR